jgi:hypothetical protein
MLVSVNICILMFILVQTTDPNRLGGHSLFAGIASRSDLDQVLAPPLVYPT